MNKAELASAVSGATGISKRETERVINATLAAITATLRDGGKVTLMDFGVFSTKRRPPRTGHDPRSGRPIQVPEGVSPVFKAGKKMKEQTAGR